MTTRYLEPAGNDRDSYAKCIDCQSWHATSKGFVDACRRYVCASCAHHPPPRSWDATPRPAEDARQTSLFD